MIDFKQLFDRYGIRYREHGKNVSRDNIVISCCWCNSTSSPDPGEHLALSPLGEYWCFRNNKHSGHSLPALFRKLGLPKETYKDLKTDASFVRQHLKDDHDYSLWRYFTPAVESEEALNYLADRLFLDPITVADKFNLRVALEGRWAGRLLIPLSVGWTGRTMRLKLEPRYDAYTSEDGYYHFSHNSSSAIVVEGSIDALRIASVSMQFDVFGKCRIPISPAMMNKLREKNYKSIYSAPDSTVLYTQAREELLQLRSYCTKAFVGQIKTYAKDFGAHTENETRSLLRRVGDGSNQSILRQSF